MMTRERDMMIMGQDLDLQGTFVPPLQNQMQQRTSTMTSVPVPAPAPPFKKVLLPVALLFLGFIGICFGIYMFCRRIGGGYTHGSLFALLGLTLFIPGFYYSRIAWYAYRGHKGFSFANIPPI